MRQSRWYAGGRATAFGTVLVCALFVAPVIAIEPAADEPSGHLVVSEVMTGGASASDEFIELYNPAATALPLEGLELVYVTATGATVSRRAAWSAEAPSVEPGRHVLVANGSGIFAPIADVVYATGMAATGGSVALRIQGASSAIDAIGWGTAASAWMEGIAAPAPTAGSTLERLPGGSAGSGQDSDSNLADFRVSDIPDPQNSTSAPVPDAGATTAPTPGAGTPPPDATPPAATPAPTPGASTVSIAAARSLPDGTTAHIRAVALTDSAFTEGGGYLDDGTAGIAVLVTDGTFQRGDMVDVLGELDDRFSQRTLRADGADIVALGGANPDPAPIPTTTGASGESLEGRLAAISGIVLGAPSELTTGLGFDLDDGSGPMRVIVATASAIDVSDWVPGARVHTVGVLGQRDSSGSGTAGYRVQPRDPADVIGVDAPQNVSPTPGASGSSAPSASPSAGQVPLVTIAQARGVERNTRVRVRGVVTLPTGLIDTGSAIIQDASGGILLRLGDEAGRLQVGQLVEVSGKASTKSGMISIQVTTPPVALGTQASPAPLRRATASAAEADEARLVVVRGALVAAARRSGTGSVSFDIDDGSGPLRVYAAAALELDREGLEAGAWVEATGPLGQETTGSQPQRGYRVWLRTEGDLAIVAGAINADGTESGLDDGSPSVDGGAASAGASIGDLLGRRAMNTPVSATIVAGPWPELGLAAVAWDGTRIAGIVDDVGARAVLAPFLSRHPAPVAALIEGLEQAGTDSELHMPLLRFGGASTIEPAAAPPAPPSTILPGGGTPAWVALVGRLDDDGSQLERDGAGPIRLEAPCAAAPTSGIRGLSLLAGIGFGEPERMVVACDGVRRGPQLVDGRTAAHAAGHSPPAAPTPTSNMTAILVASTALGLTVIGAGAVAVWRRRSSRVADAADGEQHALDTPHLSLVPVRRERGSP
jgi:hypothetical protein